MHMGFMHVVRTIKNLTGEKYFLVSANSVYPVNLELGEVNIVNSYSGRKTTFKTSSKNITISKAVTAAREGGGWKS